MPERVVPFSELTGPQRESLTRVNWISHTRDADSPSIPDWTEVVDSRYGTLHHVAIIDDERGTAYDKVNLEWTPAAFVVVYRVKDGKTEFLLQNERRVLLKDENGVQGNVFIRNIPQGLIRTWQDETPEEAALREVKEETGVSPVRLHKIEQGILFDAANSQSRMPFFLAEVDPDEIQTYQQSLDSSEEIRVGENDWYSLEDSYELQLECAKTMTGLYLATGFLGLWKQDK